MLNGKELMLGDYVNIADYDFPEAVGVVEEIYANGKEMYISIDGQAYDILSDKDISVLFLSKTFFPSPFRWCCCWLPCPIPSFPFRSLSSAFL